MGRKNKHKGLFLLISVIILTVFLLIIIQVLKIKHIEIIGNEQYTEDEIKELIFDTPYADNSIYLYWKYNHEEDYHIPFIDTIEVDLLKYNSVRIHVYEKDMVGCMEYLGSYMYFDKDGIIVESSKKQIEGIPLITGLKFDHIILNEQLETGNESVFNTILNITQTLDKHEIKPDKIYFNSNYEITMYFGDAKVYMGADINTEEKIIKLKGIVPKLEGLSGVLHMEEYDENTKSITFERESG